MNAMPLITSALLAVSVFLLALAGRERGGQLLTRLVRKKRDTYAAWSQELFLGWTPEQARRAAYATKAAVVGAGLLVYWLTGSGLFTFVIVLAVYFAPQIAYRLAKQRREERLDEQLPDAVDVMVASVRAGRSLQQAIEDTAAKMPAPIGQELSLISGDYLQGGLGLKEAIEGARDRMRLESFAMVYSALAINLSQGGDLLNILERMSESLRELLRLKHKIVTETSEVRAQEKIILYMTPLFCVMICMFDPDIPKILFQSFIGNLLLVVVAGLQAVSIYWIRRILKSTV